MKTTILIRGQDYTELSEARIRVDGKEIGKDVPEELREQFVRFVLDHFMDAQLGDGESALQVNGRREPLYRLFQNKLWFQGVVGVLEGKNISIPQMFLHLITGIDRISEKAADPFLCDIFLHIDTRMDEEDKPYFLTKLLLRNDLDLTDISVSADMDMLFDLLLLVHYKKQLSEAYEKGIYRTYRLFFENDAHIHGTIDIPRHIRENKGQRNGKIAYCWRENSENNYLNRLIICAHDHLYHKYPLFVERNFDSQMKWRHILDHLKRVTEGEKPDLSTILKKNLRPISHPYFVEYEELRQTCLRILRDEGLDLWEHKKNETKTILFYLPRLWELFLEDEIKNFLEGVCEKMPFSISMEAQKEVYVFGDAERKEFQQKTIPDFVFFSDQRPVMTLDAKFKPGWEYGISADKLPDYDKCIRDMNSLNVHRAGVIFPAEKGILGTHTISMYNEQDRFYTLAVGIPKTENLSYSEWNQLFIRRIKEADQNLKTCLGA